MSGFDVYDEPTSWPVDPVRPVRPVTTEGSCVLDEVRGWLATYIRPLSELDLDLLTLWAVHTHFAESFYTTPRLVIDSPLPESGKTTTLEHLERLCFDPLQMSSVSSSAMLPRLLDSGLKTLLIDEAEKTLRPDRPGVEDLLAVVNSGYKRGGSRPVLVPTKQDGWVTKAMPTYSPLAMAGISPSLPDDTLSRTVVVMLLPDDIGTIADSDWEFIEPAALDLAARIAAWAEDALPLVQANAQPELPEGCKGRAKEKWRPLKRVADAAGGRWPDTCTELIQRDLDQRAYDHEEGLMTQRPAIALVRDLIDAWPPGVTHWPTSQIVSELTARYPDRWGSTDKYPRGLTNQRVGRFLSKTWGLRSIRPTTGDDRERGYLHEDVLRLATRAGLAPNRTGQTDQTGSTGHEPNALDVTGRTGHNGPSGRQPCRQCGNPLLLNRPGRDTCAKCEKADVT